MAPNRVILMSCGSYNPPTNLHLRMFEIAKDHLHRMGSHEVVGGVISLVHDNYGKQELAPAEHRCAMVKLAIHSNEWVRLSTWEIRQNSWTKTRLSLQYHQNLLNAIVLDSPDIKNQIDPEDLSWIPENVRNGTDRTPIQIKLLCGADLLESFGKPGLWAEDDIDAILGQHGLVVITREGSSPNKFIYDSDILSKHMHNIYIVTEWIPNEVSSSKIRRALKRGESIRYLTQDTVIDYIYQHGIYDAKRASTTTKFEMSTNNTNNYLHIDNKYESVLLTPSPSDVTMTTPSPVEIISIDIGENVLKKNIQNSPYYTNNDRMNKYSSVIQENGNKNGNTTTSGIKSSTYPGQAKQIITTETGESQIFYEVGSASSSSSLNDNDNNSTNVQSHQKINLGIKDNNEILLSDVNDSITSNEKPQIDVLSLENRATCYQIDACTPLEEEEPEDPTPSDPKSDEESKNDNNTIIEERIDSTSPTPSEPKTEEHILSDREEIASVPDLDTDPQNPKESLEGGSQIDGKYMKSLVNLRKSPNKIKNCSEQVVPMMESDEIDKKMTKDDRKVYQGSLESINQRKPDLIKTRSKSKSFEFLKSDFFTTLKQFPFRDEDFDETNGSQEESGAFVTANDDEPDDFCSVCYSREQSIRNAYPLRSTNSSPIEPDSTECDICTSCNLQDTEVLPGMPQCEVCEICGDIAMDEDVVASSRQESEEIVDARILSGSSHIPLNTLRRKLRSSRVPLEGRIFDITDEEIDEEGKIDESDDEDIKPETSRERAPSTSVEELSGDDSTLNDIEFEIENCGLDIDPPDTKQRATIEELPTELPTKSTDDLCRINRGSSMINRASDMKSETRRRYSSVDSLPSSKPTRIKPPPKNDKTLTVRHSGRIIGSADNIRAPRPSRSVSLLRKSADDVGKIKKRGETDDETALTRHSSEKSTSRVPSDIVKFILSKRGIKIISDRETAL